MKKTVFLLVTLFFCAALRADLLDDVARQLDLLEKEYWIAQRSSDGEYHRAVRNRLGKFKANVGRIFTQLQKLRKHHRYHLDEALNVLCNNFGRIKPSVVQAFRFNMKSTSMSEYTRDFREFLQEKDEKTDHITARRCARFGVSAFRLRRKRSQALGFGNAFGFRYARVQPYL